MYDRFGGIAIRLSIAYLRRRYRRQARLGAGVAAVALAVAAYAWAARDVREG